MIKDKGIDAGLVQEFDTTAKKGYGKRFWGFRKMFWDYLNKLSVPFYDPCCATANGSTEDVSFFPVRFNATSGVTERFDGTNWVATTVGSLSAATAGGAITLSNNTVQKRSATAVNATATTTAAAIVGGLITSTSAAAVALTLPLATDLATAIGAAQGTSVDFMVDNSAGANTVTVTPNTGITAVTAVITGGATLTVASGAVGTFRIFYTSATVAKIARLI